MKSSIFISAPISGFDKPEEYNEYRKKVQIVIDELRKADFDVYSEIENIADISSYDTPGKSAINDFMRIEKSDLFLIIHPYRMQTSSLIEYGYALGKKKKTVLVAKRADIPYLALGMIDIGKTVFIESFDLNNIKDIILACKSSISLSL